MSGMGKCPVARNTTAMALAANPVVARRVKRSLLQW